MRRSTALSSAFCADTQKGEDLAFELCKGGYFSDREEYGLKVVGKSAQDTLTGKNMWGGEALATSISEVSGNAIDRTNKTISFRGNNTNDKIFYSGNFKENTQYTLIFAGANSSTGTDQGHVNIEFEYTDGNYKSLHGLGINNVKKTNRFVSSANKTLHSIQGSWSGGQTTLYYEECGLFEGNIPLSDFEPYCGGIPAPNPDYPMPIQCVKAGTKVRAFGKNLFDRNADDFKRNQYIEINGVLAHSSTGYSTSGYIAVISGKTYVISGITSVITTAYYDQSKSLISVAYSEITSGMPFTIPDGVAYLRFDGKMPVGSKVQLELGDTITSYEPYFDGGEVTTPCDLYEGDIFYPMSGKVERHSGHIISYNGESVPSGYISTTGGLNIGAEIVYPISTPTFEQYDPQPIFAPRGMVNVLQNPVELSATMSATMLRSRNYWSIVQQNVRNGLGASLYPVGHEFTLNDSDTGNTVIFVVRGHDHHKAADGNLVHTMTLETKYVYCQASGMQKAVQFDAAEALYFAEEGLAAGTYNFTVANQAWFTADNGKIYQFTLTSAVPVGGQVAVVMTHNATLEGKSVKTYASPAATEAIETATLTEGAAGTSLGTTNGVGNINHMQRIIFGSNNYGQSAVRQLLNSSAAAGSVWTPTNKFDRPPSWHTSYNGFMHGLPADFLAVVQPAIIPCRTNSVYECNSLDGTEYAINQVYNLTDKFFLLSRPEIYGSWDSTAYKDGELLDFYNGLTNEERKKYDVAGSVRYAWLRSPYPSNARYERAVGTDGSVDGNGANFSLGVAPACIIA